MKIAIRASLLALALCVGAAPAAGEPPADSAAEIFAKPLSPDEVTTLLGSAAAKLKTAAALRGSFIQRKFLKEVPQPLVSGGDYLVARGQGLEWHTRKPFDSTLVLTPQALIQRGGGGRTTRVDAARQPGLAPISQLFDALFALDAQTLAQRFELFGRADEKNGGAGWQLGLKPREAALAQRLARIVVMGDAQPRLITLFEANGDRTEIDFTPVTVLPALGDAERKALNTE